MTIFDTQMHIGPIFGEVLDAAGLQSLMSDAGISTGMLFSPDNELVRSTVDSIPGVYGLAWVNPHLPGHVEQVRDLLAHPKFLGVKLHPAYDGFHPNDPALGPVLEIATERGLPVLIHCGHPIFSLPWSIEELIVSYPSAKVILGHMGHCNIVFINGAHAVAARHPNVYLETSGVPMPTKIRDAVERIGLRRVLFGSDLPSHHPKVEITKVRVAGLSEEQIDFVLSRNGRRLFFGDDFATAPVASRP